MPQYKQRMLLQNLGKVSPDRIGNGDKKDYYDNAIEHGSTFVLYEDPL
jgi:hypothetical protein